MKILFAIKTLENAAGGAERVLVTIANNLSARGHAVTVLTYDTAAAASFYPLNGTINFVRLGVGNTQRPATAGETWRRILYLRRAIRREKPAIVIAFMHSMFVPVTLSLLGTGIPVIASEHIVPQHYQTRRLQFLLMLLSVFLAKATTVVSAAVRDLYPRFIRSRLIVMPNPLQKFSTTANASGQAALEKGILSVGRLDPQKDQQVLIAAFSQLAHRYPDWRLRIIGEGALRPALEKQIIDAGLHEQITLIGTTSAIEQEYARAQLFILPSHYESFGLAAAEALSCGLPAICFADCTGVTDLITDTVSGLVVQNRTPTALAAAMENLMQSAELRTIYGAAGRAAMQAYQVENIGDQWEALLQKTAVNRNLS